MIQGEGERRGSREKKWVWYVWRGSFLKKPFCVWRKFWMNLRQVQIPQRCLNKLPLVPLSWTLINANSSLVSCLNFSEVMIEISLGCYSLHLSKLHFVNLYHVACTLILFLFPFSNSQSISGQCSLSHTKEKVVNQRFSAVLKG